MADAPLNISPERWLETIQTEYLSDYVSSGGSAVKVISGSDATLDSVKTRIQTLASSGSYYYAHLDPGKRDSSDKAPNLHKIDKFFFGVTQNVDWKESAESQARKYLETSGIHVAEGRSLGDLEKIADDNGRDSQDLVTQYQRELATPQIRDSRLSIEFRIAITALGRALLIPDAMTPTSEEVLLGWFAGRSVPGMQSALKKVQIYDRINMATARPMLASFCRWLPQSGHNGLVVTLDFRPYEFKRLAKSKKQAEQLANVREAILRGASSEEIARLAAEEPENAPDVFYSDPAYMHMLTLIRRFIDEIDYFERFLLVILTSPRFYIDKTYDPTVKRCYYDYNALQTRIGQEVHDAKNANPAASLVQLGDSGASVWKDTPAGIQEDAS